jgi:hypothetical protein
MTGMASRTTRAARRRLSRWSACHVLATIGPGSDFSPGPRDHFITSDTRPRNEASLNAIKSLETPQDAVYERDGACPPVTNPVDAQWTSRGCAR